MTAAGPAYAMYWNGPFTLGFLKRYEVQRRCAGLTKLQSGRAIIRLFGRSADLLPLRWRAASARSHPAGTRLLSPLRGQACHLTISAPRRREIFIRAVSVRHTPHFTRHSSHPSASPRFRDKLCPPSRSSRLCSLAARWAPAAVTPSVPSRWLDHVCASSFAKATDDRAALRRG